MDTIFSELVSNLLKQIQELKRENESLQEQLDNVEPKEKVIIKQKVKVPPRSMTPEEKDPFKKENYNNTKSKSLSPSPRHCSP